MVSILVEMGGWCLFFVVLLAYVRWILLEREFFNGSDPENWHPIHRVQEPSSGDPAPAAGLGFPLLISPGSPS